MLAGRKQLCVSHTDVRSQVIAEAKFYEEKIKLQKAVWAI